MVNKDSDFRWRDSPAVIAQYFAGADIPSKSEITLGPTEICIVMENGAIVGTATQTRMEVNPKLGVLRRALGQNSPDRGFLFAEIGPHEIILRLNGTTKDNEEVLGHARVRVTLERESASRILRLTNKGVGSFTSGSVAESLEREANQLISSQILIENNLDTLRTELVVEDAASTLRSGLVGTLDSIGFRLENAWVYWNKTETETILSMRKDLENLVEKNAILSETEFNNMDNAYNLQLKKLEFESKLLLAEQTANERAHAELELERIRSGAKLEQEAWESVKKVHIDKQQTRMDIEKKQAEQDLQIAREKLDIFHLGKDRDAERAMEMFEQVQARKKDRIALENEQRDSDRAQQERSSERMIEALMKIVESSEDESVKIEALKQISELRRADK